MDTSLVNDSDKSSDFIHIGPVTDVTHKFKAACNYALRPGELCHPSWFTLQHSVSAIEIMDPKMDIRVSGARRIVPISEAIITGLLPMNTFTRAEELLGIMDELICSLVNWLTGDSLAQTVFCCMYMHCTQLLRDTRLAVFCELLRRSVKLFHDLIVSVNVFDEEDHYAPTHGMPLNVPDQRFECFMDVSQESVRVDRLLSPDLLNKAQLLIEQLPDYSTSDPDPWACVRVRLEFMTHLLKFSENLTHMLDSVRNQDPSELEVEGYDVVEYGRWPVVKPPGLSCANPVVTISNFLDKLCVFCSSCQFEVEALDRLANVLSSTYAIGIAPGRGRTSPKDFDYGIPGFEPFLNQTKLPSYIPRFVVIHTRSTSFSYLCCLFSYLLKLLAMVQFLTSLLPRSGPHAYSLHWLWSLLKSSGQIPSQHFPELFKDSSDSSSFNPSSCVFSRVLRSLLYCFSLGRLQATVGIVSIQTDIIIESWLRLESPSCQSIIRTIVSELPGLRGFFDVVGEHLFQVLLLYSLNRSRQRAALVQSLLRMGELLEECLRVEWIIGKELSRHVASSQKADLVSAESHGLQLVSYLCYYYYSMAWDYMISGFQLELYSPHEWIFMYTFLIQLLQQLFGLIERLTSLKTEAPVPVGVRTSSNMCNGGLADGKSSVVAREDDSASSPGSKCQSKRKRNKNRSKRADLSVEGAPYLSPQSINFDKPKLSSFCGPLSELELHIVTVHRLLTAATMYALRALQLDSGGDPVLDSSDPHRVIGYGNPVEIYGRRLGLFLTQSNSPMMDPGGISGAFNACRRYVTTGLFNTSTTELYTQATRSFESARFRIQMAIQQYHRELHQLFASSDSVQEIHRFGDCMQRLFGSPDMFSDLERLATRNAIACRVLATCPERRPVPVQDLSSRKKCSFLLPESPVRIEFDNLISRSYPLIRLVTPTSTS